jgi:UTP--glucose-1-phosphate uridylyltransferase
MATPSCAEVGFAAVTLDIDTETRALLDKHGFDEALFESLRARVREGTAGAEHNRLQAPVRASSREDLRVLPPPGSSERRVLAERGDTALRAGEVGCVVLAGGMATRFGGVVKAGVEAVAGRSFLSLKLADFRAQARRAGGRVPVFLMSSFATDATLRELIASEQSDAAPIEVFCQFLSLRLTTEGGLWRDEAGKLSPYAPGHGDLTFALRRSGVLERFIAGGGRTLFMSNVDNLGATLDPAVIGAHLEANVELTAEVVARRPGDPGGAPAWVQEQVQGKAQDKLQIVEDFRLPDGFDRDALPAFNTNTFTLDARAIDRDFPLTWFAVRKQMQGETVIQFEHLVGELSTYLSCAMLLVERDGDDGRFQPAKDPGELDMRRSAIEAILRARGVL